MCVLGIILIFLGFHVGIVEALNGIFMSDAYVDIYVYVDSIGIYVYNFIFFYIIVMLDAAETASVCIPKGRIYL